MFSNLSLHINEQSVLTQIRQTDFLQERICNRQLKIIKLIYLWKILEKLATYPSGVPKQYGSMVWIQCPVGS